MVIFLATCCPAEVASSLLHATVNRPRAANGIILKALIILLKAARESSHEDFRAAWSCLLWSRDVRVTPTSPCDFALAVWRACAVRRYCACKNLSHLFKERYRLPHAWYRTRAGSVQFVGSMVNTKLILPLYGTIPIILPLNDTLEAGVPVQVCFLLLPDQPVPENS